MVKNDYFVKILTQWNIELDDQKLEMFDRYYDLLISWNNRINLTAITDRKDVYIKHFADSAALLKYVDVTGKKIIDVGSGAGFPGIPLSIFCNECNVVLIDSLLKRTDFLKEIVSKLELKNVSVIHGRAEDLAHDKELREQFDIATSRAVANLSTLSEYCLPFVNINGTFISYKSCRVYDELKSSENAVSVLGGSVGRTEVYDIPYTDYERSLVFIDKIRSTDDKYPRKAGKPGKSPL